MTSRRTVISGGAVSTGAFSGNAARMMARSCENRVDIDLEPAAVIHKAVFRLVDGVQARVAFHEITDVFLFGDRLFRLPLAGAGRALFRVEIEIIPAVFLLADAADDVGVGAGQIGLHHVDAGGVIRLLERLERGQRDEILVPDLLLRGPAERFIDGAQAARDLVLKIDGIVDHVQIRVRTPCAQRQIVLFPRKLQRLVARLVAEIIGKLRALGAETRCRTVS